MRTRRMGGSYERLRFPARRVIDVRPPMFSPFYGDAEPVAGVPSTTPAASSGGVSTAEIRSYIQEYLPVVGDVVTALRSPDPRVEAAEIKAKLINQQMNKLRYPILGGYFDNEIAKLKARLAVLESTVIPEFLTKQGAGASVQQAKTTIAYAGVAAAVLLAAFLAVKTIKTVRE
jgi:hypothetical protein